MFYGDKEWCRMWRGTDLSFQNWHHTLMNFDPSTQMSQTFALKSKGKLTCTFQIDMRNLESFHRLKNSDFILESKMTEINQNKNSKQLHRPDAGRKLYFTLEINE